MIELMEHQQEASERLSSGKILYGGTGVGKSITVLDFYVRTEGDNRTPLYVITTAKKRDSLDWQTEAGKFGISYVPEFSRYGTLVVDSYNNIQKYLGVEDAFFVFDEQRLVSSGGAWVKAFLKIAKKNRWVLLSATPGDNWLDYAPVFIANGFYKSFREFKDKHVVYEPFIRIPIVKGYLNEHKLELLRNHILVEMPYWQSESRRMVNWLDVGYDKATFDRVYKDRWHIFENRPILDAAERWRLGRLIVNSHPSRMEMVVKMLMCHKRLIVFYNFDYELEILRELREIVTVAELNGHKHQDVPDTKSWVYLVQYVAGAEAWNCTATDAMVMYSMTYSYKNFVQAQGRIDRIDSPFETFFYYILLSNSVIDRGIRWALDEKRDFNERKYMEELEREMRNLVDEDVPCLSEA